MVILMATPEASPFARAGNLGDVVGGLSRALVRSGNRVAVVIPLYRQVLQSGWPGASTGRTISVPLSHQILEAEIYQAAQKTRAELVIMGSHGRTGFKRLLLGSVAERVIGRAACPVLVVNQAAKSG